MQARNTALVRLDLRKAGLDDAVREAPLLAGPPPPLPFSLRAMCCACVCARGNCQVTLHMVCDDLPSRDPSRSSMARAHDMAAGVRANAPSLRVLRLEGNRAASSQVFCMLLA